MFKGLNNNLHLPNWSEMWKTAGAPEAVTLMITVIELCIKWFETEIIQGIVRVRIGEKVPNVEATTTDSLELPRGRRITTCVPRVRVQHDLRGQDLVQLVNK